MNLIPGNIPHIPRMKNTNLKAKQLKEDAFRRIAVGPMQGTIICFSMSPRCDILGYEYTYSAFCILKRYFTLLGFKNVEYVQKEDKYGTIYIADVVYLSYLDGLKRIFIARERYEDAERVKKTIDIYEYKIFCEMKENAQRQSMNMWEEELSRMYEERYRNNKKNPQSEE